MTKVIITGGGTAGHTNPGIAVAEALVAGGLSVEDIHFIGGVRGNEGELVSEAGFSIDLLAGRGIQRKLTLDNVGAFVALGRGLAEAVRIVRRRSPKVVLCLGGYAAAGASVAAVAHRVPLIISEQNARASLVNRTLGRVARACALPYPDTDLPNGVLTGNPIRQAVVDAVAAADPLAARRRLGLPPERTVVAVWSGSLGARSINSAVRDLAVRWADRDDVVLRHVIGRRDWDDYRDYPPALASSGLIYQTVAYEHHMPDLLAAADVAVCRAGASTTTELAVAGLPAVLVPLPGAPRDHQRANAAELINAGGALLLNDEDLSGPRLAECLAPTIDNADVRARMAAAARSVARPSAAHEVARMVLEAAEARP